MLEQLKIAGRKSDSNIPVVVYPVGVDSDPDRRIVFSKSMISCWSDEVTQLTQGRVEVVKGEGASNDGKGTGMKPSRWAKIQKTMTPSKSAIEKMKESRVLTLDMAETVRQMTKEATEKKADSVAAKLRLLVRRQSEQGGPQLSAETLTASIRTEARRASVDRGVVGAPTPARRLSVVDKLNGIAMKEDASMTPGAAPAGGRRPSVIERLAGVAPRDHTAPLRPSTVAHSAASPSGSSPKTSPRLSNHDNVPDLEGGSSKSLYFGSANTLTTMRDKRSGPGVSNGPEVLTGPGPRDRLESGGGANGEGQRISTVTLNDAMRKSRHSLSPNAARKSPLLPSGLKESREVNFDDDNNNDGGQSTEAVDNIILRATFQTIRCNFDESMGRYLLGKWYSANIPLFIICAVLDVLGAGISFLSLWNFIPRVYIWSALGMYPMWIYGFLMMNAKILPKILRQQTNVIYFVWEALFIVALLMEYRNEEHYFGHVAFISAVAIGFMVIPLIDGLPILIRKIVGGILCPIGCVFFLVYNVALAFNWSQTQGFVIPITGHIRMTSTGLASAALNNLLIFVFLNAVAVVRYPDSLVTVKSWTEVVLMTEREAVLLRSFDVLSDELAMKSKENTQLHNKLPQFITSSKMNLLASSGNKVVPASPGATQEPVDEHDRRAKITYPPQLDLNDRKAKLKYAQVALKRWSKELKSAMSQRDVIRKNQKFSARRGSLVNEVIKEDEAVKDDTVGIPVSPPPEPKPAPHMRFFKPKNEQKHNLVMRPVFRTVRCEFDKFVGNYFFGDRYFFSTNLFVVFAALELIAAALSFLSLWQFIPRVYIYASVGFFPLFIQCFLNINLVLFKFVRVQLTNIFYWVWCVVFSVGLLIEVKDEYYFSGHVIFAVAVCFGLFLVPAADTMPINIRRIIGRFLCPIATFVFMVWQVAMSYNWSNGNRVNFDLFGHLKYSSTGLVCSSLNSIIIWMALVSVTALRYPNCMLTIRSRVEVITMSEQDAVVMRSYDALSIEVVVERKQMAAP